MEDQEGASLGCHLRGTLLPSYVGAAASMQRLEDGEVCQPCLIISMGIKTSGGFDDNVYTF